VALAGFAEIGLVAPAHAELKLCNSTSSRIGVAIGYKDKEGWASEGYYVYAFDYDKGGEWGGPIPMCTHDVEFTIKGIESCEGRGYKKSGFFEVDTQEQMDWTVKLTDQSDPQPAAQQNATGPAQEQAPAQASAVAPTGTKKR
jgi:uncharacterized membrane protein